MNTVKKLCTCASFITHTHTQLVISTTQSSLRLLKGVREDQLLGGVINHIKAFTYSKIKGNILLKAHLFSILE